MPRRKRTFWRGDKRFWSPVAITSGLTIFFFGVTYVVNNVTIGWLDIAFGIILMAVGFSAAPLKSER